MRHWAYSYIGLPWTPDGFGPDRFNCWGLVCHVLRTHFNKPIMLVDKSDNTRAIREMARNSIHITKSELVEGDVVTMANNVGRHAGIMISADRKLRVLHASGFQAGKPVGQVISEPLDDLLNRGMSNVEYWRYL